MGISEYMRRLREKVGTELLMMPAVGGIVVNAAGEVLLQRRSDNGLWGIPGGAIDPGEEPADAIVREVWEETGVRVIPERVIGVYGGPELLVRYPNGDEAMVISMTFLCRPVSGEPHPHDDESLEVRYFPANALPENLIARHRRRIEDAFRPTSAALFTFTLTPDKEITK